MDITGAIKTYVKSYYCVTYEPKFKNLILHDELDGLNESKSLIPLGKSGEVNILLVWGKIEQITGVQYYHKDFQNDLSKLFLGLIREDKTKNLFKLLRSENISVNLPINEVLDEFPILND